MSRRAPGFFLLALAAGLVAARGAPAAGRAMADGVALPLADGTVLRLQVCAADIIRVAVARDPSFFSRASLTRVPDAPVPARWTWTIQSGEGVLATDRVRARVDLATGRVTFLDAGGRLILAESPGGRSLEAATVQGLPTWHPRQQWQSPADEALYGLGQQQLGLFNLRGYDLDLWQHNGTAIVPFLVSSRGYGILWDNASYTRFGDLAEPVPIDPSCLRDAAGQPGALTGTYFADAHFGAVAAVRRDRGIDFAPVPAHRHPNLRLHPALPPDGDVSIRWEGFLSPPAGGDTILQAFSNGGLRVWIDDTLVMDHWRQGWLPWIDVARLRPVAGAARRLRVEWTKDQNDPVLTLRWKPPVDRTRTSLWSEAGDGLDYYFVYGPRLDAVIAGYRRLTGAAPMMPRWAFGLWQSRQRYRTAQESLEVVAGFRSRGIPFDTIVQDWMYWKEDAWGSHQFDPGRFPDPAGWIRRLHDDYHAHLVISVWGKFYPGTANFAALQQGGFLYPRNLTEGLVDWLGHPYTFYDAFNPAGRKLFWSQVDRDLFRLGVDGWWLDATEPDLLPTPTLDGQRKYMNPTALGPGSRVLNAYSLVQSEGVYEGQRKAAPDRRVFILTRSAFAGQQRYAAATWSGDTTSTWTALRKQIAAGLDFALSGIPYWTTDAGGFAVPARFSRRNAAAADVEEWRELATRWFEYAAFCPVLRVHGEAPNREMWEYGGDASPAYAAQLKADRLRYRLLPYLYSLAGGVAADAGTLYRPLVMDFPEDIRVRDLSDEFMLGPALLISPVSSYRVRHRPVYLPAGSAWYDFWTGRPVGGGQTVDAAAPYDAIPVHVRAGSIVPLGPEVQYTGERAADPVTLRVYGGADGRLVLYEDDGETFRYEKGECSRIPVAWNDAERTLTIGARQGVFPGMLAQRTFRVILVEADRPLGYPADPTDARTVAYGGQTEKLRFP